ncbi:hypothetical protein I552_3178 [Mycobacterium xenopi 3993]|nr:hypothetical protein I552_3178 [Mycobacterium xenopi 3993]
MDDGYDRRGGSSAVTPTSGATVSLMTVPVVGQRVSTLAVRRWHLSMVNLCGWAS